MSVILAKLPKLNFNLLLAIITLPINKLTNKSMGYMIKLVFIEIVQLIIKQINMFSLELSFNILEIRNPINILIL